MAVSSLIDLHPCSFPSALPSSQTSALLRSRFPSPFLKKLDYTPLHSCSPLRSSNLRILDTLPLPHHAQDAPHPFPNLFAFFHEIAAQAEHVQEFVTERFQVEVWELARIVLLEACRLFGIAHVNEYLLQYSSGLQLQFAGSNVFFSSANFPGNLSTSAPGNLSTNAPENANKSGTGNSSTNTTNTSSSLAGILAATAPTGNKWEDKARIRRMMEERGIKKEPGVSRIEVNGKTHTFMANDRNHPQLREIHRELDRVINLMKEAGYEHDLRFVLHDISDEAKERALNNHSEKLAICYGFLMTPPKSALRIVKNLRVCGDCHTATKFMSKISQREIIVRDAFRFHHFKNGVCSCGDYW